MYFCVSQAPSRYYGLVCALCFQDLSQQLEVLLIYTYCTSSHRRAAEKTFANGAGSTCGHVEPFNIATALRLTKIAEDGVIQYSHQR